MGITGCTCAVKCAYHEDSRGATSVSTPAARPDLSAALSEARAERVTIEALRAELARVTEERDAAVRRVKAHEQALASISPYGRPFQLIAQDENGTHYPQFGVVDTWSPFIVEAPREDGICEVMSFHYDEDSENGELTHVGYLVTDEHFSREEHAAALSAHARKAVATERNERTAQWWCPTCGCVVDPRDVTYQETHDARHGGCGNAVESQYDARAYCIGRAVLASGITAEEAALRVRELRNTIGSLRLSSPSGGRTLEPELRLFEAIHAALRDKVGR